MMCGKYRYYTNPDSGIHCCLELSREGYNTGKVGLEPDFKGIRNLVIEKGKRKPLNRLSCGESKVLNGKDAAAGRAPAGQNWMRHGAKRRRAE